MIIQDIKTDIWDWIQNYIEVNHKFYDYKFPITLGNIKVTAKKEILEYFYKSGLGSRASSGFGMCEIID